MPTIRDVAREAGVSIATVSYVLNGKQAAISEETRQQVWEAARTIGYTANVTARNLRANRSRLIGYEWHDVPRDQINPVLDRFTYYLARAAEAAGYHILTFTTSASAKAHERARVYDELLRSGRVDAFVLSNTQRDDLRIAHLIEAAFPFVSFGRANTGWDHAWVDCDGQAGVRTAVRSLAECGHRKIALVAWPEDSLSGEHRVQGYRDAVAQCNLVDDPVYIQRGVENEATGRKAVQQWFTLPAERQPTAIVTVSDLAAIGAMNEAEHHGRVIGQDLSIIGFDDAPMSQYLRPALTTLRQPIPEIADAIMRLLEAMLNGEAAGMNEERTLLYPPELIERRSVAVLNALDTLPLPARKFQEADVKR